MRVHKNRNPHKPCPHCSTSRRKRQQFVAEFGDSLRKRRLSPNSATVAENGDYSRQCGHGFNRRSLSNQLNAGQVANTRNRLQLNADKTEFMWCVPLVVDINFLMNRCWCMALSPWSQLTLFAISASRLSGQWTQTVMSMGMHISKLVSSCYFRDLETYGILLHTSLANAFFTINSDHRFHLVQGRLLQCCTVRYAEM